jgi:TetR/AcrR family transcriptional regulator, repressor of fatR-cypB operon
MMRVNVHSDKSGVGRGGRSAGAKRPRGRPKTGGKREEILDAALRLFTDRGYHGTTIPEIAAKAGVAAGTIYSHFLGKEHVVNVLYRRTKQRMIEQVLAGLPGPGNVRQQFHQLWHRLRAFERADPVAFTFLELHHHADYLDRKSRVLELEALLPVARFLEGAAREGHVRPMSPPAMMAMVWGAFVGLVKAQRVGYLHLTDELSAQVEMTLWDAIKPRPGLDRQERHP